jgi:hypothetical protein
VQEAFPVAASILDFPFWIWIKFEGGIPLAINYGLGGSKHIQTVQAVQSAG